MLRRFLLALLFVGALASTGKYNGAKVFSITPRSMSDMPVFELLENNLGYDIWKYSNTPGRESDVMIMPSQIAAFKKLMDIFNIEYKVKIEDVGKQIRSSYKYYSKDYIRPTALDWTTYYPYSEISAWMDQLAFDYPDLVRVYTIGQTWEGNDVKMLKISTDLDGTKDTIVSEAAIHAREWIAPAVVTYIMNELVTNSANYADTLAVIDFMFVPVTNIDGYDYSFENEDNRLWRKTREPDETGETECYGTDGNRNFDIEWAGPNTSDRPCSDSYHGITPFSAPETQNIRDLIYGLQATSSVVAYLGWHSAADTILRPYGYARDYPTEDEDALSDLCERAIDALEAVNGYRFTCILSGNLYPTGGASDDWGYQGANVTYTYTPELRDNGSGFLLPEDQIIPSGQEMFEFFRVIFEQMRDLAVAKKK